MRQKLLDWLEERSGILPILRRNAGKPLPPSTGWLHTLGTTALVILIVQFISGALLAFYYAPTPDHAWNSIQYIEREVVFGRFIRGLHHWGASVIVVVAFLHLLRVYFFGAYKRPRELTWIFGVMLLLGVLGFAFTGYLLPWEQKAYWATVVGTRIAGTVPVIGPYIMQVMRGGEHLGALTLSRFFAVHVLILPAAFLILITGHLYLIRRLDIAGPLQGEWDPKKEPGIPFFPDHVFKEIAVAGLVFLILASLAAFVPVPTERIADPTDTTYVPRPDWYFLFLFQLLHYFKGPLEPLGTFILPALGVLALFLLPFLDRSPHRHPLRRPLAAGVGVLGILLLAALTLQGAFEKPPAQAPAASAPAGSALQEASLTPIEREGRTLYVKADCASCHSVAGVGGRTGPDLSTVGSKRNAKWLIEHFRNPMAAVPGSRMVRFDFSDREVSALATYLLRLNSESAARALYLGETASKSSLIAMCQDLYKANGCE